MVRKSILVIAVVVAFLNFFSGEAFRLGGTVPLKNQLRKEFLLCSQNNGDIPPSRAKKISADVDDSKLGTLSPRKSYDTFGKLSTFAQVIDERTGGWGLGYADTRPYNDKTLVGFFFLATNICYFWAGTYLFANNNYLLSATIEVAGFVSLYYHWSQIHFGPNRDEVRYALLIDYITAFAAINFTFLDLLLLLVQVSNNSACDFPLPSVAFGFAGVACLLGSWAFEFGLPYIVLHGLWHVFSSLGAAGVGSQLTSTACS